MQKMLCRWCWSLGWVVAWLACSSSAQGDLINGDFETGDFSGWDVFVSGELEISSFAHSGQFSARFGSAPALSNIIQQAVDLDLGATYQISMWVYNSGVGDDRLWITDQTNYGLLLDPVSTAVEQWEQVIITFTYTTDTTNPFQIWADDDLGSVYVDDISLTQLAVPEPALGFAGIVGFIGVTLTRRRRK